MQSDHFALSSVILIVAFCPANLVYGISVQCSGAACPGSGIGTVFKVATKSALVEILWVFLVIPVFYKKWLTAQITSIYGINYEYFSQPTHLEHRHGWKSYLPCVQTFARLPTVGNISRLHLMCVETDRHFKFEHIPAACDCKLRWARLACSQKASRLCWPMPTGTEAGISILPVRVVFSSLYTVSGH